MTGRVREDLDSFARARYDEWRIAVPTPKADFGYYMKVVWVEGVGFVPDGEHLEKMLRQAEFDAFNGWTAAEARKRIEERKKTEKGAPRPPVSTFDLEDLGL